ncbi:hypothetical protein D3C84_1237950 [compost metagenome]
MFDCVDDFFSRAQADYAVDFDSAAFKNEYRYRCQSVLIDDFRTLLNIDIF